MEPVSGEELQTNQTSDDSTSRSRLTREEGFGKLENMKTGYATSNVVGKTIVSARQSLHCVQLGIHG